MADTTLVAHEPRGWLRWALRFPIILYRMRLGWLLGGRFMLIHHTGRKTGQPHQTVVEVVAHNKDSDTYYVASGWGYKSNWYLNLMAHPETTIQVGTRRLAVNAENLSGDAAAHLLVEYREKHAFAAKELGRFMGLDIGHATESELRTIVRDSLPLVAFRRWG
ncbi:MAG: nitroreductase family deazaflavin-dependent oxidoreductase [Anaerolineae bacterium]